MKTKSILFATGAFLTMLTTGLGHLTNRPPEQAPPPMRGSVGVATRQTVINVSEIAQRETIWGNPDESGLPAQPLLIPASDGGANSPFSPAAASSFLATEMLGSNPTLVGPDTQGAVGPNHLMVIVC